MLDKIDIKDIVKIAKDAGNAIMQIYDQDFDITYKKDNSPLTIADRKANDIIEVALSQLTLIDNIPILSEEGRDIPYSERKGWEYFWLVDPLDGTKEFVKRNGEFTVNIALIHKDVPVLGVVYAPALNICYWAKQGDGAFKDSHRLPIRSDKDKDIYKIVASRSHMSDETKAFIENIRTHKEKETISIGSSLKICLVAEGEADLYPRLGPTMEWDTGAAHVIASESKCRFRGYFNNIYSEFFYNKKSLLNSSFIVDR